METITFGFLLLVVAVLLIVVCQSVAAASGKAEPCYSFS